LDEKKTLYEEYVLIIEDGEDKDNPGNRCPISRLPNGKRALFKREHWDKLKTGETWSGYIDSDRDTFAIVVPVKKIYSALAKPLDSDVEDVLYKLTCEELKKMQYSADALLSELKPLTNQFNELCTEIDLLHKKMDPLDNELAKLQIKIKELERAKKALSE